MDKTALFLLEILESKTLSQNHYTQFYNYLKPVASIKQKHPSNSVNPIQPLAKQFLPFICQIINLLPSLIRKNPNQERDEVYLAIYRLINDCLVLLSPVIVGKPYAVHLSRGSFVICLVTCEKYEQAESEASLLLNDLISILNNSNNNKKSCTDLDARSKRNNKKGCTDLDARSKRDSNMGSCMDLDARSKRKNNKKGCTDLDACINLPEPETTGINDSEINLLFKNIIVCFATCAYKSKSKSCYCYKRILNLVEQVQPWLQILDMEASGNIRKHILNALYGCISFLTIECESFNFDFIKDFYFMFLNECSKISVDVLGSYAGRICKKIENSVSLFIYVLEVVTELFLSNCKVVSAEAIDEFLKFIAYLCNRLYDTDNEKCKAASIIINRHINEFHKVSPPFASILSLYSLALDFKSNTPFGQINADIETLNPKFVKILKDKETLQNISNSAGVVSNYSYKYDNGCTVSFRENKGKNANISFLSYLDVLESLIELFIPCIEAIWSQFCSNSKLLFDTSNLSYILQVLQKFTSSTISSLRIKDLSENEKERLSKSEKHNCLLRAVCCELRICFISNTSYQLSSMNNLLSSDWITSQEIKYLNMSLSNMGCKMYNLGHFEKAKTAMELWYEAILANIKKNCFKRQITKDIILDAYTRVASIISTLSNCDDSKSISNIMIKTLVELTAVEDSHGFQSSSFILIKTWVKVLCKEYNDSEKTYDAPVLYKLLSKYISSLPKKTFGRVLEQEIAAYACYEAQVPNFCIKMQEKVSGILLNEVYSSGNHYPVERSKVLVIKARFIRSKGSEHLKDCLNCLSQAISLLKDVASSGSKVDDASIYHELAIAYCLHAQCIQEANLDFEGILGDIESALYWWSIVDIEHCSGDDMLILLCSIMDLLSIKGCFKFHSEIFKLISAIFKHDNLPVQKLFALLWTNRRLVHSIFCAEINLDDSLYPSLTEFNEIIKPDNDPSLFMFLQSLFSNHPKMECNYFEKIKSIASSMASKADSISLFLAGYAYYDLSERLLSQGQFIEALYYARESFELRLRVFRRKFNYSQSHDKPEDVLVEAKGTDMTQIWPDLNRSADKIDSFLSPWIILRCFMQSTFQVGSICESTGNAAESEFLFRRGKEISNRYGLHFFEIIFASSLGQIYRKRKILDMAETELKTAKTIFEKIEKIISCDHCKVFIETSICLLEGDISCSQTNLKDALNMYQSAVSKLDQFEIHYRDVESCKNGTVLNQQTSSVSTLKDKNSFKNKINNKGVNLEVKPMRMTRSRVAAAASKKCKDENVGTNCEIIAESSGPKRTKNKSKKCKDENIETNFEPESSGPKRTTNKSGVVYDKGVCLCCLMRKNDPKSVQCLLNLGFEVRRRRFVLLLRLKIARLAQAENHSMHEIHEMYWKSISLISCNSSEMQGNQPNELLSDDNFGKTLHIERALILYNMAFMLLKNRSLKKSRSWCCSLSNLDMSVIISWLLRAFVLSQESPLLLTKVSRFLACIFQVSKLDTSISLPLFRNKSTSSNQYASFFHQASIGASLDIQYLSTLNSKGEDGETTAKTAKATSKFQKYSFESIEELEDHVACFFKKLPKVPIICMSMLGNAYSDYIGENLTLPPYPSAWIMLSRINSTNQPITMLLPVNLIAEGEREEVSSEELSWKCPWDHNVLDDVAPSFKRLMEDNFFSMKNNKADNDDYWNRRREINRALRELLKNIEESWFGPWRCLLKGDPTDKASSVLIKHSLAKAVLCGATSLADAKACHSQIVSYGGYLGHGNWCRKDKFKPISSSCDIGSELLESLPQLIDGAFCEEEKKICRDPVIFVLDSDIQMVPWDNLPSLRKQEVYRMPSVGSIFLTLDRNSDKVKKRDECFPKVNPFDAYYLVNPDGDLKYTQGEFEPLCRDLNWEGKAGDAPTSEELSTALKNHDMFLYFGHGSGSPKYISGKQIEELNKCAASFLMGCSSGSLISRGNYYAPEGISLSYLFAGSPAIIGNLWDVTDKDIDRFSKAVLDSWLQSAQPVEGEVNVGKRCIASCMAKARDECRLGLVIGAAPVCYGVPTVLCRGGEK